MNDRLQERLARAMVKQSGLPTNVASTTSSMGVPSRTASPLTLNESRSSVDASPETSENLEEKDEISAQSDSTHAAISVHKKSGKLSVGTEGNTESELRQPTIDGESGVSDIITATSSSDPVPAIGVTAPLTEIGTDLGPALLQLQAEHEASEARWQEELHGYVERIDALQAKLKYLAKEAAESAKIAAASASPGSPEKKLFEKDERIAALMEEGQKLSKMELDHRATIKKLRRFIAEKAKSEADAKRRIDILENDLSRAEEKAQRCELAEQRALVKVHAQTRLERDLAAVTNERDNLSVRITDLNSQISKALARAEAAERKAQSDSTAAERRRVAELKDDLSSAKIEREISEEKLRREIRDLKETLEREKERSRVQETELQGELSVLEGKMETLRARAEEVSSSATGDAQAKLLRQIERLQTQYAVARENWNGIETSLITRLANVEKERDEIARREGDLRRKVREAVSGCPTSRLKKHRD